jgi:sec-independent protein translocase protein TatA
VCCGTPFFPLPATAYYGKLLFIVATGGCPVYFSLQKGPAKGVLNMFEGLFQPMHLILILLVVLIIFGPGKLPELGSGLGKSIREFKKAMKDGQESAAIEKKEETKV